MHSEAEQTETSEFGAEKDLCRAKQGEWVAHAEKPQLPDGFWGKVFIGKIWGAGCVTFFCSVVR